MPESSPTTLDPADWQSLRAHGHRMLDDMFDHIAGLREGPVWQPIPDTLRDAFRAPLPQAPGDIADAHARFMRDVLPYSVGNAHPRFMGWVQGGGTAVGMLAEMLAAGLNANLGGRDQMPLEVERQVVHWMRELFGFPAEANGVFVTGSSTANLIGVLAARTALLGREVRARGLLASGRRLTAYAACTAHGCIPQALEIAGIGSAQLRSIATNARHEIDLEALSAAIAEDRAQGCTPFLIVGCAGAVDVGAVDDLRGLARIARDEQLWFHVDGAYGALGRMAPGIAALFDGIEHADSIALDFHKWGQVPYDAGFVLVRDGARLLDTFAADAAYLRRDARGMAAGSPWPCDLGPDLSRGFRALKTWFTFQVYGAHGLGAMIDHTCALARRLAQRVEAEPELELLAEPRLNIVCFRYRAGHVPLDALNALNAELVADLQISGLAAPSTTTLDGRLAIRAAIVNHRTCAADIDMLVDAVLHLGRARAHRPHEEPVT